MQGLPGRLLHTNVVGCAIFAAVSGSSATICATIGKMSLPELTRRGYPEIMSVGSLAGAGTLGLRIPPSIIMNVYGVTADVSISQLFIGGVIPGVLLALIFSLYIGAWSLLNAEKTPPPDPPTTFTQKLSASRSLIPVVLLIAAVLGSIYTGIATATEAAGLGVLGCFLDGISMVALTMGVIQPTVQKAGIDPLWFGIFIVIVVEMAQVTPPVGFNLFVLQGMTKREIGYISRAAFPFFLLMLLMLVLPYVFPQIVTVLPDHMKG